jgi:hypothetical protein
VVDEEALADGRAGVDFNASQESGDVGHHASHYVPARAVKDVCQAVEQDRVQARVTENDFQGVLRGRIFAPDGFDVFPEFTQHESIDYYLGLIVSLEVADSVRFANL